VKKRFTETQIIGFLREAEAGLPVKQLWRIPLSTRDHRPHRVVVPPIRPQFSERRRPPRGARDHRHLRDDPTVAPDLWSRVRSAPADSAWSPRRHLVSG